MKLDPGMHIGMHLVFFGKSGVTALFIERTTNIDFAVHFPDDARQTKTHGIYILCRAFLRGAHGNHKSLPCVFLGTHDNSSTLTFDQPPQADRP
jgi:hypothetical protein